MVVLSGYIRYAVSPSLWWPRRTPLAQSPLMEMQEKVGEEEEEEEDLMITEYVE